MDENFYRYLLNNEKEVKYLLNMAINAYKEYMDDLEEESDVAQRKAVREVIDTIRFKSSPFDLPF
jgi:hypothetical protein